MRKVLDVLRARTVSVPSTCLQDLGLLFGGSVPWSFSVHGLPVPTGTGGGWAPCQHARAPGLSSPHIELLSQHQLRAPALAIPGRAGECQSIALFLWEQGDNRATTGPCQEPRLPSTPQQPPLCASVSTCPTREDDFEIAWRLSSCRAPGFQLSLSQSEHSKLWTMFTEAK